MLARAIAGGEGVCSKCYALQKSKEQCSQQVEEKLSMSNPFMEYVPSSSVNLCVALEIFLLYVLVLL